MKAIDSTLFLIDLVFSLSLSVYWLKKNEFKVNKGRGVSDTCFQ